MFALLTQHVKGLVAGLTAALASGVALVTIDAVVDVTLHALVLLVSLRLGVRVATGAGEDRIIGRVGMAVGAR